MTIDMLRQGFYRITTPFDKTGTVFLYLLKGDSIALIDTGAADSPMTVLQPALAEIGLALSDVDLILNTHAHLDHSGGNLEVKGLSGAQIHLHADDLFMAESTEAQVEFHTSPLVDLEFPAEALKQRIAHVVDNAGEPAGADVLHRDGDTIDLGKGIQLRMVHCPGHTPGHVAYYWETEGVLLTADCVQGQGARPGSYPYYFNAGNYRRSLSKISELDFRMLCLGHAFVGGTLVNSPCREDAEARAFLQSSMDVADTIHRAVAGATSRMTGASHREIALEALSELIYHIPQLRLPATNMPMLAGPTLLANMKSIDLGDYPA